MTDNQKIQQSGEAFAKCVELGTTPSGPTMADVREAYLASEAHHREVQFTKLWNSAHQSIVSVPLAVVEDWKRRIGDLQCEVSVMGLNMVAAIFHPDHKPVELYGRPLKWDAPVEPVGPTGDTISLCLSTATMAQLNAAMEAIRKEVAGRDRVSTGPRTGMGAKVLFDEVEKAMGWGPAGRGPAPHTAESIKAGLDEVESLMEPRHHRFKPIIKATEPAQEVSYTSQRMKGLDELQRQLATAGMKVKPYLSEGVHIESCPVIGKQPTEAIDLSGESI